MEFHPRSCPQSITISDHLVVILVVIREQWTKCCRLRLLLYARNYLIFHGSLTKRKALSLLPLYRDGMAGTDDCYLCLDREHGMRYIVRSSWVLLLMLSGCGSGDGSPSPSSSPTATATGSISFEWDPSPVSDLAGYRVYRSTTSGSFGAPIATLPASATRYQATGLRKGHEYFFVVSAYDGNGNESQFSNQVSRTVP